MIHSQHWIRLEMQPNIAVEWLRLLVDPADSSYMPTHLVVSGGDSLAKMKELNMVRITPSDTWVTLLRSIKEVSAGFFCLPDTEKERGSTILVMFFKNEYLQWDMCVKIFIEKLGCI